MKKLIIIGFIAVFGVSCIHLQKNEPETDPATVDQKIDTLKAELLEENTRFKNELEYDLKRTIRNEIIPELREISTYSNNMLRSQKNIKKKVFKKTLVGRVEWISTVNPEVKFRARVDSGAQTNSMHAEDIKEIVQDGKEYVEFTTIDDQGTKYRFLREIVKETRVKSTSGHTESRYVVKMDVMFGQKKITTNVNLNNRKILRHNFLIGRNLLLGNYIIDVSQSRLLGIEEDEKN